MTVDSLRAEIDRLLSSATRATVPSGVLHWWGQRRLPDGSPGAPPLTQNDWEEHYGMLELSALWPGVVRPLASIQRALRRVRHDGPIPVAVAYFNYAKPHEAIVTEVTAATKERRAARLPESLEQAISEQTAFMAAALLPKQWNADQPKVRARVFDLMLDGGLFVAAPGTPVPDLVTLDCGDGQPHPVRFGERVTCICPRQAQDVVVTVTARWGDTIFTSRCRILISDEAAAPPPDERWPLFVPGGLSGEALVFKSAARRDGSVGPGSASIGPRRFVIVAEGFPGSYPEDYLFDQFNQHRLLESCRQLGFDIALVTFHDGMNLIQLNAEVMIQCIARACREGGPGSAHVVCGFSMGGLVARYALALMEQRDIPHGTAVYLSIDAPHRGSRTSVADQWFAHFFKRAVPQMAVLVHLLESKANQQFLPQWFHEGRVVESPLRTRFFVELAQLGSSPKRCLKLAVASGCGDGRPTAAAGTEMVRWSGSPFVEMTLRTQSDRDLPMVVAEGHCLRGAKDVPASYELTGDGVSWETVAGSFQRYNLLIAACVSHLKCGELEVSVPTACAVPTASALDLDLPPHAAIPRHPPSGCAFDDYAFAETNQEHTLITPAICRWILYRIRPQTPR